MGTPGPQKIHRYELAFKLRAVQMSQQPGVLIKDVAESLCIHPFMLSRWRKQVRDGVLVGKPPPLDASSVAELQRLQAAGARWFVIAWPAFWWLEYYTGLNEWLRTRARRVWESERLIVFALPE